MPDTLKRVVIVGGGLAAVRTAQALRDQKFQGNILILSEENELPYDRPPLSKNYLTGRAGDENIRLASMEQLSNASIQIRLGQKAVGLNCREHIIQLDGGDTVTYDDLVVATGAAPIRIPIFDGHSNVHVLRSANDARQLRKALSAGTHVGIVGGGFIGLEIAAVALALGCKVTVIEATEAPLTRVLGPVLGRQVQRWHERKGVNFLCGSGVVRAHGKDVVTQIELANGANLAVDCVVVGVGQKANTEWLLGSGLALHRGLECDELGRTSDPHVFGVGDAVCCHVNGACNPTLHWTATTDQAQRLARLICGETVQEAVIEDHYFWSDQHGSRLQFVGTVPENARIIFASGGPDDEKYVALCCAGDEVKAVLSLASPRDFLRYAMPLRSGEPVPVPT